MVERRFSVAVSIFDAWICVLFTDMHCVSLLVPGCVIIVQCVPVGLMVHRRFSVPIRNVLYKLVAVDIQQLHLFRFLLMVPWCQPVLN